MVIISFFIIPDCELPESWRGQWFHSTFPVPVTVDARNISVKGECVDSDSTAHAHSSGGGGSSSRGRSGNMFLFRQR